MVWTDRLTEMVVGRGLADQLERARLEKIHEGAEQRLKQTTYIAFEPRLEGPKYKDKDYMFHRTESLPLELPQEGTLRPRRPKLQRSQSEIGNTTRPTTSSPSGPPDITAVDLAHDHVHRAYSQVDVRPPKPTQMPPLEQMTGFGKYRRSIHADPEWQMQQYRANLRDFPGLVPQLGDFKLADPDPVVWDQFCQESARSNSFASSKTSHSKSSESPADWTIDRRPGPVITRGFAPSTTSSAASSFRDSSSGHGRKDSGMSMTSPSGESDNKLLRFPSRQSALSLLGEPTALTAINEDPAGDRHYGCKVSQLLSCNTVGNVENALESDYDEDSDDDDTQMKRPHGGPHSTAPLTLRPRDVESTKLTEKATVERMKRQTSNQHKPCESKVGLDRSTTVIKKPVRHVLRRTVSRGKPPNAKRMVASVNAPASSKKANPVGPKFQAHVNYALPQTDEFTEAHEDLDSLGLYMANAKASTVSQREEGEVSKGSFEPDSTVPTLTTKIVSTVPTNSAMHPRRNRSQTTVRVDSKAT